MTSPVPAEPSGRAAWAVTACFAAATAVLAGASVVRATPVSVVGLALCGMAHVVLELRYVVGRSAAVRNPVLGWLIVVVLSVAALSRFVGAVVPGLGGVGEILLAYGLLALMAVVTLRRRTAWVVVAAALPLAAASLAREDWYFWVLTHAHNAVPLIFLWDWSRRLATRAQRGAFMAVHALWAAAVPLLIVSGRLDAWINVQPGVVVTWSSLADLLASAAAPPGADVVTGARYLACFAFTHSMHYVVWVLFLPWAAPEVNRSFDRTVPLLRGRRVPVLALVAGIVMLAVFVLDSRQGNLLYSILAAYHVYVEIPVVVLLVAGAAASATLAPSRATGAGHGHH